MSTKNSTRRQETINKIERVFIDLLQNKDISQITVSEICKKAELNRNTFYLYFTDVYDLADKFTDGYFSRFFARLSETKQDGKPLAGFFIKVLEYIADNQATFKAYFKVRNSEEAVKKYGDVYYQILGQSPDFSLFLYGQIAVVRKWLKDGCKDSPEEMSEAFMKYVSAEGDPDFDSGQRDKNVLRKTETTAKIENALVDLLQAREITQISVSDICGIAGISREDFYSYYQDIFDLADRFARKLHDNNFSLLSDAVENNNLYEVCMDRFDHVYRNQRVFTAFLKLGAFKRFLEQIFVKYFDYNDSDPVLIYLINGQQMTVLQWAKNGFDTPPEEIAGDFITYLKKTGIWYKELKQRDSDAV